MIRLALDAARALAALAGATLLDALGAAAEPVRRSRCIPPTSTAHCPAGDPRAFPALVTGGHPTG